ncbi:MAG: YggS family pyridoxal phosphate-dependent enzyme [Oscillospiraceae bacterium]|nr:YggS family pyridoxal phosphate-dependent enzyme [Oscillospiraceae bacterium]
MMERYTKTISDIRARIRAAAVRANRDPDDISLVAATKTRNADEVRAAIVSGVDACGENRVQEMLAKLEEGAYHGAPLHFIGHLQTNKVRSVVGRVSLIQSLDSIKLAKEIDTAAKNLGIKQEVLVEINIGEEKNKSGFLPNDVYDAVKEITQFDGIVLRGLMAIPPIGSNAVPSVTYFSQINKIFVDITPNLLDNGKKHILSMGMSDDFEAAVECGSTMVRVGSAIFGER